MYDLACKLIPQSFFRSWRPSGTQIGDRELFNISKSKSRESGKKGDEEKEIGMFCCGLGQSISLFLYANIS